MAGTQTESSGGRARPSRAGYRRQTGLPGAWLAALAGGLLWWPTIAAAQPVVHSSGRAVVSGGDQAAARKRALEEAVRQAVQQATGELTAALPAEQRERLPANLNERLLARARSYLDSYRVLAERELEGAFEVELEAQVADDRLRRDLLATLASDQAAQPRLSVRVRLLGARRWLQVAAVWRTLATLPGVVSAVPHRISPGEVVFVLEAREPGPVLAAALQRSSEPAPQVEVTEEGELRLRLVAGSR
jgi:hypothetical protein